MSLAPLTQQQTSTIGRDAHFSSGIVHLNMKQPLQNIGGLK